MTVLPVQRDDLSEPFFAAAARGELLIRRCKACGAHSWPVRGFGEFNLRCPACGSDVTEWVAATGEGTLASWAIAHQRPATPGGALRQTVLALVELAEGPWLGAQLIDVDQARLADGLPLRVAFVQPDGGECVPVFRPRP
jgi:uncharacterized protein